MRPSRSAGGAGRCSLPTRRDESRRAELTLGRGPGPIIGAMAETVVPDLAAAPAKVGRDRHRGLELLRATEAAALSVGRWLGRGDKSGTRDAGQRVMEEALVAMPFDGRVVIGPDAGNSNLAAGRRIGVGRDHVDLAIIPVDGVSLVSRGLSQALSIAAAAEPGGILSPPPVAYMTRSPSAPPPKGLWTSRTRPRTTCAASPLPWTSTSRT